jgi:hypothetical protein
MRAAALALVALVSGCGNEAVAPPSRAWTMFDIAAAFSATPPQPVLVGVEGAPAGLPAGLFVKDGSPTIPIQPAFAEGGFSPYITTNLWANMPEVWIQPLYIFVRGWDPNLQKGTPVMGQPWIYTVAPTSRFHSPFWRVYWVELPDPSPRDQYTRSDQIFADHLTMHEGPGRLVSLVPLGTRIADLAATAPWYGGHMTSPITVRTQDYLDGAPIGAIDFGFNRFEWNRDLEVIEQPFFVFFTCPAGQACGLAKVPNVGGTGPLFSRRPAILPGGKPRFGSFWRLYFVTLPNDPALRVFIPPGDTYAKYHADIEDYVKGVEPATVEFTPDPAMADELNRHFMQVAMNGSTCFKDPASFVGCRWIDSQTAVEENLANSLVPTGITVTCPFVGYDDQPVPLK